MTLISTTLPNDGDNANAASVDNPFNAIIAVVNGQLDFNNLLDGGVTNAKLAGGITIDKFAASTNQSWVPFSAAPNTVTPSGNHTYSLVFNALDLTGIVSPGMKMKMTRSVTAPTQSATLNGTSQFFNKTSPAGMTFTDDFVVSAWVKMTSFQGSAFQTVASRYNGTSGWSFGLRNTGQVELAGFNAGAGNNSLVVSAASIPLNRWVHIAAQLDMSSFTATATTSYVMIDGQDVSASVTRAGTNPTALIQAGNLEIGSRNAGVEWFGGKIAQVAIYNTKVTEANILASMSQALVGTETGLISAYSFSNTANDLNANANNLTAQSGATVTAVDSPFAGGASILGNATVGTTEYAQILDVSFSTNTTIVVQTQDGYQLPSSGGISAASYSTVSNPFGWPGDIKVLGLAELRLSYTITGATPTYAQVPGLSVTAYVPKGRRLKISFGARSISNTGGSVYSLVSIWDGTPSTVQTGGQIGEAAFQANIGGSQEMGSPKMDTVITPSASGFKTYNIGAFLNASAGVISSNISSAAFILVELE